MQSTVERLMHEDRIPVAQVCREAPGNPDRTTVTRWLSVGLCDGNVVLESFYAGHRRFTSREALCRFFDRVTRIRNGKMDDAEPVDNQAIDTSTDRVRSAMAELEEAGI